MGTSFIPGPDLSFIGDIGKSISQIIDPGRERRQQVEEFFLANPEIGQQFAAAQREAERQFQANPPADVGDARVEGVVPNVLEQFGFDPGQAQQTLKAFPESAAERLGPERETAELIKLRTEMAKNNYSQVIIQSLLSGDVPNLEALQAGAKAVFGRDLAKAETQRLDDWNQHLESLRETDPSRFIRAVMATANPNFLQDLQHRETLALRERELNEATRIANIEATQDAGERELKIFDLIFDAQTKVDARVKNLTEVLETGTEEEKLIAIMSVNESTALVRALSPMGAPFVIDPGKRGFWNNRLKGIRLTRLAPGTLSLPHARAYEILLGKFEAADPGSSFEAIMEQLNEDEDAVAFLSSLTPVEGSKFFADAQARIGALQLAQQVEEDQPTPTSFEEERKRIREQGLPGVQAFLKWRLTHAPVPAAGQRRMRGR